uniref:Uncharacterized protein n=1 Tax=Peronospora matthiolae TaxID=2874970 RepID=A0AAV1U752_9STRA
MTWPETDVEVVAAMKMTSPLQTRIVAEVRAD